MLRIFISIIICLFIGSAYGKPMPVPLSSDQAFKFSSFIDKKNQLMLEWQIAPGYYLYQNKIHITPDSASQIKIGKIVLPPSGTKKDELHGTIAVYSGMLKIPVPLVAPVNGVLNLNVAYQGCSMDGFCYPPMNKDLHVRFTPNNETKNVVVTGVMQQEPEQSDQGYFQELFSGYKSKYVIILTFLGLGLLLSFTPCVLPMVPILSGIILGHKKTLTTTKAFLLSLSYVLGMAVMYAIAGIVVALIGSRLQTIFQATWVIVVFSALFVLLALSLFGFYELALPAHWQQRITALSNRQKGGNYISVFIMGALSSLIVSPCVSAPLVGVLAYIAQTGDIVLGAVSLLALGIGMGIPLILLGVSAGKFLPKAGTWMITLERIFGIFLLGFAIWILSRVIPGPVALFLWAVLLICTAIYMGVFSESKTNWKMLSRGLGLVFLIYGAILIIGAVLGNSDPLRPWEGTKILTHNKPFFTIPTTMAQLDDELNAAKSAHKPVMLDFYADWCTSCVVMERNVFSKPQVQQLLNDFVVLRADVTKNNEFDQAILKRFNVIAPPTIIFFDRDGEELTSATIVGEESLKQVIDHIQQLNLTQ